MPWTGHLDRLCTGDFMYSLYQGYSNFRSHVYPQAAELFRSLADGQQPPVCLITCSDSRVVPETILQAIPGEVFVIRNAGNLVPAWGETHSGVAATVEYAVAGIKVQHLVVCGHSGCGAMREVLERKNTETLPALTAWLGHAGPSSKWLAALLHDTVGVSDERKLRLLTEANVLTQLAHLRQYPAVAAALAAGTLQLHGWMFEIGNAELRVLDQEAGIFRPAPLPLEDDEISLEPEQMIA
jgi:carbonic anhydrase